MQYFKKLFFLTILQFFLIAFLFPTQLNFQCKIDKIVRNYDNNELTKKDRRFLKTLYKSMILYGKFFYPEASKILDHYLFGDGSDLLIKSGYFKKSDFIKNKIKGIIDKKTIGPMSLRISTDPRVAYAVNGFYIRNENNKYTVFQKINFDDKSSNKNLYTTFNIFDEKVKIPDRLIRIFEEDGGCKEFNVYIYWYN